MLMAGSSGTSSSLDSLSGSDERRRAQAAGGEGASILCPAGAGHSGRHSSRRRCGGVQIRDDVSEREASLSSVASQAGVTNYAYVQNAGYRGLSNLNISELKRAKGLKDSKRWRLDFIADGAEIGRADRCNAAAETLKSLATPVVSQVETLSSVLANAA